MGKNGHSSPRMSDIVVCRNEDLAKKEEVKRGMEKSDQGIRNAIAR